MPSSSAIPSCGGELNASLAGREQFFPGETSRGVENEPPRVSKISVRSIVSCGVHVLSAEAQLRRIFGDSLGVLLGLRRATLIDVTTFWPLTCCCRLPRIIPGTVFVLPSGKAHTRAVVLRPRLTCMPLYRICFSLRSENVAGACP